MSDPWTSRCPSSGAMRHRLHEPGGEIWVGVRTPGTELPARAERIRAALASLGRLARWRPSPTPTPTLLAVHDRRAARLPRGRLARLGGRRPHRRPRPGPGRAVPLPAPRPDRRATPRRARERDRGARRAFAYDTMTLIGPGTWEAARARGRRRADRRPTWCSPASRPPTPAAARPATTRPGPHSAARAT